MQCAMMTSNDACSESVNRLREKIRRIKEDIRNTKRENEADSARLRLGEISQIIDELETLTEKDVTGLAMRTKRRKHAASEDLFRLSQAFLLSQQNIIAYMKIPGALNVVIKELTGTDSKLQAMACETLCNLTLGDEVTCEKIAAAAGTYLITHLDNSDIRLQKTSVWTITNICATNGKGIDILLAQNIVSKLIQQCISNKDPSLLEDLLCALDILLDTNINLFSNEQLNDLRAFLITKGANTCLCTKMLFTIVFSSGTPLIEEQLPMVIKIAVRVLHEVVELNTNASIRNVIYSTRILANCISRFPDSYYVLVSECQNFTGKTQLSVFINKIFHFNVKGINREMLWLLKNISSCRKNLLIADDSMQGINTTNIISCF